MSSVVVKSIDEAAVRRAAEAWGRRVLDERPEVEEIVFFGSFSRGTWAPGSDLDVFLFLRSSEKPIRERMADYLPGAFPVGVDLLPYTRDEVEGLSPALLREVAASRWRLSRAAPAEG